jgi:hypothetical protein
MSGKPIKPVVQQSIWLLSSPHSRSESPRDQPFAHSRIHGAAHPVLSMSGSATGLHPRRAADIMTSHLARTETSQPPVGERPCTRLQYPHL